MKKLLVSLTISAIVILAAGCGGGGSERPIVAPRIFPDDDDNDGFLLDSSVSGMQYQSGEFMGTTDADGGFTFVPGQPVVFRIHDIDVMTVMPESVTTPADAASNGQADHQESVNIARFLQSLDSDGDVDNGIQLDIAEAATKGVEIDFNVPAEVFSSGTAAQFVNSQGKSLIGAASALRHLEQTIQHFDDEDGIKLEPIIFAMTVGQSQTVSVSAASEITRFDFRSDNSGVMAVSSDEGFMVVSTAAAALGRVVVEVDLEFADGSQATKAIVVRLQALNNLSLEKHAEGD